MALNDKYAERGEGQGERKRRKEMTGGKEREREGAREGEKMGRREGGRGGGREGGRGEGREGGRGAGREGGRGAGREGGRKDRRGRLEREVGKDGEEREAVRGYGQLAMKYCLV